MIGQEQVKRIKHPADAGFWFHEGLFGLKGRSPCTVVLLLDMQSEKACRIERSGQRQQILCRPQFQIRVKIFDYAGLQTVPHR